MCPKRAKHDGNGAVYSDSKDNQGFHIEGIWDDYFRTIDVNAE